MECIYCGHPHTYELANSHRKCRRCRRKFSPKKIEKIETIIECFCKDVTTFECAKKHSLSYLTVKKQYAAIRSLLVRYLEERYQKRTSTQAFEEYIYLEKSKDPIKDIFDGYNFLTFVYDERCIYNILMPDLARFKNSFYDDGLNQIYYNQFRHFLRSAKITKNPNHPLIYEFWDFLESFLPKFRGIKRENFFFYLKEAEFKFNFDCVKLKSVLRDALLPTKAVRD